MLFGAHELLRWNNAVKINGEHVPARPLWNHWGRWKHAWWVFTGRCDAVWWPEDGNPQFDTANDTPGESK